MLCQDSDSNVSALSTLIEAITDVSVTGSCGGHTHPYTNAGQAPIENWYVEFTATSAALASLIQTVGDRATFEVSYSGGLVYRMIGKTDNLKDFTAWLTVELA